MWHYEILFDIKPILDLSILDSINITIIWKLKKNR